MPPPAAILTQLSAAANDWRALSVVWHLVFGALGAAVFFGWRPGVRQFASLLIASFLSVSVVAWLSGNPFNGTMFAVLALLLAGGARRLPETPIRFVSPRLSVPGALVVLYGLVYPHFLSSGPWTAYLYAAPFGVLPCPTVAVVIGFTLMFGRFGSTLWTATLVAAGLAYGVFGVIRLGVLLDAGLLVAAAVLAAAVAAGFGQRSQPIARFTVSPGVRP